MQLLQNEKKSNSETLLAPNIWISKTHKEIQCYNTCKSSQYIKNDADTHSTESTHIKSPVIAVKTILRVS